MRPRFTPEQMAAYQKAQEEQRRVDWANLTKYRAADEELAPPAADETRVVFMGDSITEGWSVMGGNFFPGKPYINRGISGQTSPQMLVRFMQDVVDLNPKVVVILAGTNDIAENTGPMAPIDTERNIRAMADLATANGIRVVLCSITPSKGFWWNPSIDPRKKIAEINTWLRDYAQRRRIPFVDYYSMFADADGGFKADLSMDGVHPNKQGFAMMVPVAQKAIDDALRSDAPGKSQPK